MADKGPRNADDYASQDSATQAYLCVLMMGCSMLTPWLTYITAIDYFQSMYAPRPVDSYFPVANMCCLFVTTVLVIFSGGGRLLSMRIRLVWCQVAMAVLLVVVPLLEIVRPYSAGLDGHNKSFADAATHFVDSVAATHSGSPLAVGGTTPTPAAAQQHWYHGDGLLPLPSCWLVTFCTVGLSSIFVGVYQSTCFGLTASLGGNYTSILQTGQAIASVWVILLRCLTKWIFGPQGKCAAMYVFFVIATLVVLAGVASVNILRNHTPHLAAQIRRFEREESGARASAVNKAETQPLVGGGRPILSSGDVDVKQGSIQQAGSVHAQGGEASYGATDVPDDSVDVVVMDRRDSLKGTEYVQVEPGSPGHTVDMSPCDVFVATRRMSLLALYVFCVCLGLFPGVTSIVPSRTWNMGDWFPIILIGVYNVGDLVGKTLPQYGKLFSRQSVLYPGIAHGLFLPVLLLALPSLQHRLFPAHYFGPCADFLEASLHSLTEQGRLAELSCRAPDFECSADGLTSMIFCVATSDAYPVCVLLCLGVATGYLGCLCLIYAPEGVPQAHKGTAGSISTLSLILGLAIGSLLGMGLVSAFGS